MKLACRICAVVFGCVIQILRCDAWPITVDGKVVVLQKTRYSASAGDVNDRVWAILISQFR